MFRKGRRVSAAAERISNRLIISLLDMKPVKTHIKTIQVAVEDMVIINKHSSPNIPINNLLFQA